MAAPVLPSHLDEAYRIKMMASQRPKIDMNYLLQVVPESRLRVMCGFDIYLVIEPTVPNQKNFDDFINNVLGVYQPILQNDEDDKSVEDDTIMQVHRTYIEFLVGDHPIIPLVCQNFLRFSSNIGGTCSNVVTVF